MFQRLDCNDVIPTIYNIGDRSCTCDSKAHDGAVKFDNEELFVCLNGKWQAIHMKEVHKYGTEHNPGSSCKDILDKADGEQLSDGVYWIRLNFLGKYKR